MAEHVSSRRRVAGGLACVAAGATALAWGLAAPAFAHGKQEPEQPPVKGDKDCSELAEAYGVDQDWSEFDVDDVQADYSHEYLIDDRGSPDESDDATVTVTIEGGTLLQWESTIGIDAVLVKGSNAENGSYFYLYAPSADDEEETSDYHLGVPPWNDAEQNTIAGVQFCYDDEYTPPSSTSSSTTSSTTEASSTTSSTEAPTTTSSTMPSSTSSSVEATTPPTEAPTTAPPTTQPVGEQLPRTGSNTLPLVAGAAALLAVGAAAVLGRRYLQGRP